MNKKIILTAATIGLVLSMHTSVFAGTLDNESIGLKMEIDDQDQLEIISPPLISKIENSFSMSLFNYEDVAIAYLMVAMDDMDSTGYPELVMTVLEENGYKLYDSKISQYGFNYYLAYLDENPDSGKSALAQSIQEAYAEAEFYKPVEPKVDEVDFKAITLDGDQVGKEIFAEKDYTIISVWAAGCEPCREEMPELAAWEKELPENVQILYLDIEREGIASADRTLIDEIIRESGIDRNQVILYENQFSKTLDMVTEATPTTLIVDSQGKIIGNILLGAQVDRFKEIFSELPENE